MKLPLIADHEPLYQVNRKKRGQEGNIRCSALLSHREETLKHLRAGIYRVYVASDRCPGLQGLTMA